MGKESKDEFKETALDFLDFVNASPTPFHLVHNAKERLKKDGFAEIKERDDWASICEPGGKYYLTRNGSTILAFTIGEQWERGNPVAMIGAHTDSPTLRLKPTSKRDNVGWLQVGVETYGSGLWHTWFDRDLSVAGRAMVKTEDGSIVQKLVKIDRQILRIPTLAIHLDRQDPFTFSKEAQLFPIAGLVSAELERTGLSSKPTNLATPTSKSSDKEEEEDEEEEQEDDTPFLPLGPLTARHHPHLVAHLAASAGVSADAIVDFEVTLYDTQEATIGGLNDELIFSQRLDNNEMSYCALTALIRASASSSLSDDQTIRLISLFDHEEIGSLTAQGADSNLLPSVLERLSHLSHKKNLSESAFASSLPQTLAKSFLLSADVAHAVHPNYVGNYEAKHHPLPNGGPVLKINANARYATSAPGVALIAQVAREQKVPLQTFVVSNVSPCGGTIGPMSAAKLGVRTLDLGNPILSMHSIRETGGVKDVEYGVRLMRGFLEGFGRLGEKIFVD